ncbi:MAG: glutamate--tRNA ligase [Patescibacteria group bacterium]
MNKQIVTRFAPSPTGFLHIGSLRSVLYTYLETRRLGGKYILRIEDTDRSRFVEGAVEDMRRVLDWFGIEFDESPFVGGPNGPYIQSERIDIYKKYAEELVKKGWAYYCFCTAEELKNEKESGLTMYSRKCSSLTSEEIKRKIDEGLSYVIRLRVPKGRMVDYDDRILGFLKFESDMIDDQVLLKSDGYPTYHLAVVVDDHLMGVSLVTRAMEWVSSTPKQILLYEAFGWDSPDFAHLPPVLGKDKKKKLGKRDGDTAVTDYVKKGYLKEALINYLVISGWHPQDNREIFSLEELKKEFSLDRLNKVGSAFDIDKLNWFNKEYLKKLDTDEILERLKDVALDEKILKLDKEYLKKIIQVEKTRLNNLSELNNMGEYYFSEPKVDLTNLVFKKSTKEATKIALEKVMEKLSGCENWEIEEINKLMLEVVKENNLTNGDVFWPVRYALTGAMQSASPVEMAWVLGRGEGLKRLQNVINIF